MGPRNVGPMDEDDLPDLLGDLLRFGTVETVDLAAATATVACGEVVSPPLHWLQFAGEFRLWSPPSKGEQVLLLCPEGDIAGGVILRGLNSTSFPAPASGANPQLHGKDGLIITLTSDGIQITAPGGVAIDGNLNVTGLIAAGEDVVGGGISLKSHTHGGVQAGTAQTGAPS